MEILFSSAKMAKVFSDHSALVKEYGEKLARNVGTRLLLLESVNSLVDVPFLPPIHCHPLKGDRKGLFAVDISKNYRLIFRPEHAPIPRKENGEVALERITKITILGIEDYH